MELRINYATFKSTLGALSAYYSVRADGSIDLWSFPAWGDTNACTISSAGDIADFDGTIKPTAVSVQDSGQASAIDSNLTGGRRATKEQPFTKAGRNFIVSGARFSVPLGDVTNCDILFAEEREIQGARICVKNQTDGDFVDFHVVHPQSGIVLTWADKIYVKPGEGVRDEYITGDSKTIAAGMILRMVYHSIGLLGQGPIIYLDFLGWR